MKTLHEWAGGDEAIRRLIGAFYDRGEGDELLSPFFPGGVSEEHRAHVTAWRCEVFGGEPRYTKELGRVREHARASTESSRPSTTTHP